MTKRKFIALFPIACALIGLCVVGILLLHKTSHQKTMNTARPAFSIDGLEAGQLPDNDTLYLINVFASWCMPCRLEHPHLSSLAADIPLYGIAFMDTPDATDRFLAELGNPYIAVGHDIDGVAGAAWGIYGVPTTFLLSGDTILWRHDGPLDDVIINQQIKPYLEGQADD